MLFIYDVAEAKNRFVLHAINQIIAQSLDEKKNALNQLRPRRDMLYIKIKV